MKTSLKFLWLFSLAVFSFMASCKKEDEPMEEPQPDEMVTGVRLVNNETLGSIVTDNNGQTLYFFSKDASGNAACIDGCTDIWPIFYVENLQIGSGLDATEFEEITRSDGKKQTTYRGWPLYYYSPTANGVLETAGETKGEAVNNLWFVAKPDYSIMLVNNQLTGHNGKSYLSDYTEGTGATSYFTDAFGRTIYSFTKDYYNTNKFTAADFSNDGVWPIFYDEPGSVPSILNKADFGKIDVYGKEQLTYKGNPLYYFGQDAMRGENKGVSYPAPGVWPVVNVSTVEAPMPPAPTVKLTDNMTFGKIMTDGEGRSLYFFTKDVNGMNHCEGGCKSVWPVFYATQIVLPDDSPLLAEDFKEITLGDGITKQTTYKGWPLYYYSNTGDGTIEPAGEIGGNGVNNVWYVAKESYDLMIADAQLVGHDGKNYTSDYVEGDGITRYFTDINGRTIYIFTKDYKDTNKFTASDFSNNAVWPIFYTEIDDLPSFMNKSDFGVITVYGEMQLTYKGRPLYYFGQDAGRGENKGVSFPAPGVWPIINDATSDAPVQ